MGLPFSLSERNDGRKLVPSLIHILISVDCEEQKLAVAGYGYSNGLHPVGHICENMRQKAVLGKDSVWGTDCHRGLLRVVWNREVRVSKPERFLSPDLKNW